MRTRHARLSQLEQSKQPEGYTVFVVHKAAEPDATGAAKWASIDIVNIGAPAADPMPHAAKLRAELEAQGYSVTAGYSGERPDFPDGDDTPPGVA